MIVLIYCYCYKSKKTVIVKPALYTVKLHVPSSAVLEIGKYAKAINFWRWAIAK